jgi:hypothetical protein
MTIDELERRAALIRQIEVAEIMARMDATDAMEGPSKAPPRAEPELYRPAASTVGAFWYLVNLRDSERFKAWLRDHSDDAPFLLNLLETK